MADEKRVEVKVEVPKEGGFDITEGVKIYATDKAPYHRDGAEVYASKYVAEKMVAKGWATKTKK